MWISIHLGGCYQQALWMLIQPASKNNESDPKIDVCAPKPPATPWLDSTQSPRSRRWWVLLSSNGELDSNVQSLVGFSPMGWLQPITTIGISLVGNSRMVDGCSQFHWFQAGKLAAWHLLLEPDVLIAVGHHGARVWGAIPGTERAWRGGSLRMDSCRIWSAFGRFKIKLSRINLILLRLICQ